MYQTEELQCKLCFEHLLKVTSFIDGALLLQALGHN